MRSTLERRKEILDVMNVRRHDTVSNLAFEFGVNEKTIRRDIETLTLDYPIYTMCGKHGGGVYIMEGRSTGRKRLSDKQAELLNSLLPGLNIEEAETMRDIIKTFAVPKKGEKRGDK